MSPTPLFQKSWRWLFWPAMVIGALNIENVAAAVGIDKLLTTRWPALNRFAAFLLSDTAFHIALLIAGGGIFAWGSYLLRKMDEGVPSLRSLGLRCEELGKAYSDQVLTTRRYTERRTEKLNAKLAHYDIAPAPFPDMDSRFSRRHVAQYLNGLAAYLKEKDLDSARNARMTYLTNLEAVGFVPRPLPDIEEETQP